MIVTLNWLKEFIDISIDYPVLAEKFNLMSAEVSRLEHFVNAHGLVIGEVKTCEKHPDAAKLHLCQVDVGDKTLQIICGAPNVMSQQKVIVALEGAELPNGFTIKATKIRGVFSYGMICSLDELGIDHKYHQEDGIHVLSSEAPVGEDPLKYLALDDVIMELDLTPNRADLMSHLGVAFDLHALAGGEMHLPDIQVSEISEKNPINVFTETNGCPSYYARVVKNVSVRESPQWIKSRLIACGIRPINNVVDISNYVMLELGQPLHLFDYEKIDSKQIVVRQAKKGEKLVTLDQKERKLIEDDLVITNGKRAIALAGVMGGKDTEVSLNTTMVLIESATFDPIRIRKTSKRLDLRSESSIRFERGLDPNRTKMAIDRAAMMLESICGGETLKGVNFFDTHLLKDREVFLSLDKLSHMTGRHYLAEEVNMVFEKLNFKFNESDGIYRVHVPSRRPDIRTDQDLVEEIVRIHGYRNIPTTFPKTMTVGKLSQSQIQKRALKEILLSQGLDETITYSLVSENDATLFDFDSKPIIKVLNPLTEDRMVLRHSLLPSLIRVLSYNLARKCDDIRIFEMGSGYFTDGEKPLLAALVSATNSSSHWQHPSEKVNFFTLKGLVEAVLAQLAISHVRFERLETTKALFHPGISAAIIVEEKRIGYVGRLHPELEHSHSLNETYVFELDLSQILDRNIPKKTMALISKYPAISRDLALLVDQKHSAQSLIEAIREKASPNLREVKVFDVYTDDKLGQEKKSIAFNLVFQNEAKTLETEEVDKEIDQILDHLSESVQASIRKV